MFFLMRMTFWFSLVLLMLPFGGGDDGQQVGPLQALMTAREAVGDIAGICERKPDVCETGKSALHTIGVRAKASAKIAYDMLGEPDEPSSRGHCCRERRRGRHHRQDRDGRAGQKTFSSSSRKSGAPQSASPSPPGSPAARPRRASSVPAPSRCPRRSSLSGPAVRGRPSSFSVTRRRAAAYIRPVNTTIDTIRDDFAFLDEWEDRYRYIIELGQALAP